MIQHLLKATRQGKKSDNGFKKEAWSELQRNFNMKFGIGLTEKQFHTRGQTVIYIASKANCSYIRNTKSFRQLWIRVDLDEMT